MLAYVRVSTKSHVDTWSSGEIKPQHCQLKWKSLAKHLKEIHKWRKKTKCCMPWINIYWVMHYFVVKMTIFTWDLEPNLPTHCCIFTQRLVGKCTPVTGQIIVTLSPVFIVQNASVWCKTAWFVIVVLFFLNLMRLGNYNTECFPHLNMIFFVKKLNNNASFTEYLKVFYPNAHYDIMQMNLKTSLTLYQFL